MAGGGIGAGRHGRGLSQKGENDTRGVHRQPNTRRAHEFLGLASAASDDVRLTGTSAHLPVKELQQATAAGERIAIDSIDVP